MPSLPASVRISSASVAVVFYDTTTMYFESREDDVRIPGWSKDGKNANPQVVLGLLVGPGGRTEATSTSSVRESVRRASSSRNGSHR